MLSRIASDLQIYHRLCRACRGEIGYKLCVFFAAALASFATPTVAKPPLSSRLFDNAHDFTAYPAKASARFDDGPAAAPSSTSARSLIFVSNETTPQEPDTDIFALMSGKCRTLEIAGRDFACRAVALFHSKQGRTNFTVALDDPTDGMHIISFSGESGQRTEEDVYELHIDQMLLNSKDRPKADGLPVPRVELSVGICRQLGSFAARQISSISCSARDNNGNKYELHFESDGSPIIVRRISQSPPTISQHPIAEPRVVQKLVEPNAVAPEYREAAEKRRTEQIEQLECRHRADIAKVLPRERTTYIIQCLGEFSANPATTVRQ